MATPSDPLPYKIIDKQEMQRLISLNLFVSVFAKLFHLFTRFFLPPFILTFVSLEEYGIWTICFTVITYLNLGAMGVTSAYIRYTAEYHAKNEIDKISGLISTGTVMVTVMSLLSLVIFWFLLEPLVTTVFKISPSLHETAYFLFLVTAGIFSFQVSTAGFLRMLNGLQKIVETTVVFLVTLTLETILIVVFLWQGFGIYALMYALIIRTVLNAVIYLVMSFKYVPGLVISFKRVSYQYYQIFYRFGGIVQISSIIGLFLNTVEKLIASTALSMQATALLGLGTKFPEMARSLPASMNAVYLPAASYIYSQQRQQELIDLYLEGTRLTSLVTGFMMGFLAAFSIPLLVAWLGTKQEYRIAAEIMSISTLLHYFHALTGPGSSFFKGIDRPVNNLVYSIGRLILTVISVTLILGLFGVTIINIILATTVATVLASLHYIYINNRFIGVPQWTFITKVMLPGLTPYAISYLLYWSALPWLTPTLTNRWQAFYFIVINSIIYTLITFGIVYGIIFNQKEKNRFHRRVLKVWGYLIPKKFIKP